MHYELFRNKIKPPNVWVGGGSWHRCFFCCIREIDNALGTPERVNKIAASCKNIVNCTAPDLATDREVDFPGAIATVGFGEGDGEEEVLVSARFCVAGNSTGFADLRFPAEHKCIISHESFLECLSYKHKNHLPLNRIYYCQ